MSFTRHHQVVHFILLVPPTDVRTPPHVAFVTGEVRVKQINVKICNLSILMSLQIPKYNQKYEDMDKDIVALKVKTQQHLCFSALNTKSHN